MNYINEIFERASIQQIRSFLLNGVDTVTSDKSYMERLKEATAPVAAMIKLEKGEESQEMKLIYDSWTEYEKVYMEIGVEVGIKLAAEYFHNLNAEYII